MISRATQAVREQRGRAGTRPAVPDAATSAVPETLSGERRDRRGGAERALRFSRKALPGAFGRQEVSIRILDIAASVALLGAAGPLLVRYDTLYVRKRSVRLNAFILVQTIPVVLLRRGWR